MASNALFSTVSGSTAALEFLFDLYRGQALLSPRGPGSPADSAAY
jgi:hypothetical protein